MKIDFRLFWIGIVSLAIITAHAGSLDFVGQNLGLDVSKTPFGSSLTNYPSSTKTSLDGNPPESSGVEWYKTEASSAYTTKHSKRSIEFGFLDGRLVAIKVTIWSFDSDKEAQAKAKATLDDLFAKFREMSGSKLEFQDANLRITYVPFCNSSENIVGEIQITPPVKK